MLGDPGQPVADRRDRAEQVVAVWLLPVHGGVDAALEGVEKKVVGRLGERRARQRRNDVGDVEARPREGLGTEHGVRPPEPPLDPVGGVQYRRGQRQVAALPRRFVLASLDEPEQKPTPTGPGEQLIEGDHMWRLPSRSVTERTAPRCELELLTWATGPHRELASPISMLNTSSGAQRAVRTSPMIGSTPSPWSVFAAFFWSEFQDG